VHENGQGRSGQHHADYLPISRLSVWLLASILLFLSDASPAALAATAERGDKRSSVTLVDRQRLSRQVMREWLQKEEGTKAAKRRRLAASARLATQRNLSKREGRCGARPGLGLGCSVWTTTRFRCLLPSCYGRKILYRPDV